MSDEDEVMTIRLYTSSIGNDIPLKVLDDIISVCFKHIPDECHRNAMIKISDNRLSISYSQLRKYCSEFMLNPYSLKEEIDKEIYSYA